MLYKYGCKVSLKKLDKGNSKGEKIIENTEC